MRSDPVFTYFVLHPEGRRVKIGMTGNVPKRVRNLSLGGGYDMRLLLTLDGNREAEFHAKFAKSRIIGEWFHVTPEMREWLRLTHGVEVGSPESTLPSPPPPIVMRGASLHELWIYLNHAVARREMDEERVEREEAEANGEEDDTFNFSRITDPLEDVERHFVGWAAPEDVGGNDGYLDIYLIFYKPFDKKRVLAIRRAVLEAARATDNEWAWEFLRFNGLIVNRDSDKVENLSSNELYSLTRLLDCGRAMYA